MPDVQSFVFIQQHSLPLIFPSLSPLSAISSFFLLSLSHLAFYSLVSIFIGLPLPHLQVSFTAFKTPLFFPHVYPFCIIVLFMSLASSTFSPVLNLFGCSYTIFSSFSSISLSPFLSLCSPVPLLFFVFLPAPLL